MSKVQRRKKDIQRLLRQLSVYRSKDNSELVLTLVVKEGESISEQIAAQEMRLSDAIRRDGENKENLHDIFGESVEKLKIFGETVPKQGIGIFVGIINDKKETFVITIPVPVENYFSLSTTFAVHHLLDLMLEKSYGLILIDSVSSALAILTGDTLEILNVGYSHIPPVVTSISESLLDVKREAIKMYIKRVNDEINLFFTNNRRRMEGLVIAGRGKMKDRIMDQLDEEGKKKIVLFLSPSYGADEEGMKKLAEEVKVMLEAPEAEK